MKKILTFVILPVIIISLAGLVSCKNRSSETALKNVELANLDNVKKGINENVYQITNSAKVVNMLSEYGVTYLTSISNPSENAQKYSVSAKQAQNLGAYGADLSYATLYNQQQVILNYLGAIRKLSNELRIEKIYDESFYQRLKNNAEKKDSLVNILTSAFNNSYSYLSDKDQQALGLLIVGGAWVEGMHLTTSVSGAAYNIEAISRVLLEQKKSFDQYLEITQPLLSDSDLNQFVKSLEPVKQVYAGLTTSLTQKNIDDITRAVETIRKEMIQ